MYRIHCLTTRVPASGRSLPRCSRSPGYENAAPYGSCASWASGGSSSASWRAAATHAAVRLGDVVPHDFFDSLRSQPRGRSMTL